MSKFVFENWQSAMKQKAETLPAALRYGLGIGPGDKAPLVPEQLSLPEYAIAVGEGSAEMPLLDALQSNMFDEFFMRTDLAFAKHAQFAQIASRVLGGRVIVAGGKEQEMIHIRTTGAEASGDLLAIVAKRGSHVTIIDELHAGAFFGRTMFLVVEEDAKVFIASTMKGAESNVYKNHIVLVGRGAEVTWGDANAEGRFVKSDLECVIEGEGGSAHIYRFLPGSGERMLDVSDTVSHHAHHTRSRIHALGFADDTSRIIYRGLIDMPKGLRGLNGSQEGKFVILSKGAKVDAIPSLDIASREVECAHKLTVSAISERDLFYPRSRGLSTEEAKALIVEGLSTSSLSCIKNDMITAVLEPELI
jgi:Fe-S cluster assembly protein SufD